MSSIRRGNVVSFSSATWTALVLLDGADLEVQVQVGQWIPSAMMAASADVAVLMFDPTNSDDGVVLGPYGAVSLWDYPALSGLTTGQVLRATSALAAAFGALDLANANAITGILPAANYVTASGTWTPTFKGSTIAGIFTYSAQVGFYIKLGGIIFLFCQIGISAIGTPPTGNMTIEGLPFTSLATYIGGVAFAHIANFKYTAASLQLTGVINPSSTTIILRETFTNAGNVAVPAANFTNAACELRFVGAYMF